MIIPNEKVVRISFGKSAFRDAQIHYQQFPRISFEDDFIWYCENGWVHIEPDLFAMFCLINVAPKNAKYIELAWFVRYARGEVDRLIDLMPFPLNKILWCRNDEDRLRLYRTKRLLQRRQTNNSARKIGNSRSPRNKVGQVGSIPTAESRKVAVT